MAIHFVLGDLLESKTEVLVNPVNCYGVMGKGLALQFKKKYPSYFQQYKGLCDDGMIRLGRVHLHQNAAFPAIVSFPTKNHWSDKSLLENIDQGLSSLSEAIESMQVKSIAIPQLGCGFGGLPWESVRELIVNRLSHHHDCDIYVYGSMI